MAKMVKLIAETTHQVQKALSTNTCTKVKYIENRKPKPITTWIHQKGASPCAKSMARIKIIEYIANPAKEFGIPKVLLCLLY